ncbi:dihydrofolate reductase family protein [Agromyces sp. NPDC049794]|uniref:dihydrofolate reductase family protein n=1 Tax=unclassified Agromyces TaxID=2639701 RepID=UPI0033D0957A
MPQVFLEMTMTVDGFVTAPGMSREHPFGVGGERVHEWILRPFGPDSAPTGIIPEQATGTVATPEQVDRLVAAGVLNRTGAFVIGRRTFEAGEHLWGDRTVFGLRPCFVVTDLARDPIVRGRSRFEFVTQGVGEAVRRAGLVASAATVTVIGNASIAREALLGDLVDELRLHLVPVLLGAGDRLFPEVQSPPVELELLHVERGARATHLRYRVIRQHRPGGGVRATAPS